MTMSSRSNTSTGGIRRILPDPAIGFADSAGYIRGLLSEISAKTMSAARTRIGVIGAGNIATIAQLPTLVARDDVELRAVVTRQENPEPLMRRWGFGKAFPTIEAMIADEDLDAVFVLTPRSEHLHATRLALRAGIDVFCEKPLAPTAEEAQLLADLAAETSRVLMVGFNRRFAPVYEAGRAAFAETGASLLRRAEEQSRIGVSRHVRECDPYGRPLALVLRRRARRASPRTLPVRTSGRRMA